MKIKNTPISAWFPYLKTITLADMVYALSGKCGSRTRLQFLLACLRLVTVNSTFGLKKTTLRPQRTIYMCNSHESGDKTRNYDLKIYFRAHLRGPIFLVYYSV